MFVPVKKSIDYYNDIVNYLNSGHVKVKSLYGGTKFLLTNHNCKARLFAQRRRSGPVSIDIELTCRNVRHFIFFIYPGCNALQCTYKT